MGDFTPTLLYDLAYSKPTGTQTKPQQNKLIVLKLQFYSRLMFLVL